METSDVKLMSLRRDGECVCGMTLPRGTKAGWHRTLRIVLCTDCLRREPEQPGEPLVVEAGLPGGSLEQEYARRTAARERRVREKHPRLGGLILRWGGTPRTTQNFATGAEGEREVAAHLEREVGDAVLFLYNRRRGTGRERGDIDVLAIAPSGVWIIDPKKYRGRSVRTNRAAEIFVVDGRRRPQLSASMHKQIDVVTAAVALGPCPDTPVRAAYCFVGADLPWGRLVVDGVPALSPKGVVKELRQVGPVTPEHRQRLHLDLHGRFPPA